MVYESRSNYEVGNYLFIIDKSIIYINKLFKIIKYKEFVFGGYLYIIEVLF